MQAPERRAITLAIALPAFAACTALAAFTACDRRAPIASCDEDLRGVYVAGDERWMLLDNGPTLEAYPLFPDGSIANDLVVAPRVIDLERGTRPGDARPGDARPGDARPGDARPGDARHGDARPGEVRAGASGVIVRGVLHQRFMRRAERCDASVPVEVTRCAGDALELVLADPSPPISFSPCVWARPGPSRIVRWRRE